tara:strand:+ start:1138 stop:1350 length:213 start_codon:yes stop_codon:yes gene_type:complete
MNTLNKSIQGKDTTHIHNVEEIYSLRAKYIMIHPNIKPSKFDPLSPKNIFLDGKRPKFNSKNIIDKKIKI